MRLLQFTGILLMLFSILIGCSGQSSDSENISNNKSGEKSSMDAEGYVIDKTDDSLTVVWDIAQENLANKTTKEILAIAKPNALTVSYTDTSPFSIGDKVAIQTTGKYEDSYPRQSVATDVKLIANNGS